MLGFPLFLNIKTDQLFLAVLVNDADIDTGEVECGLHVSTEAFF